MLNEASLQAVEAAKSNLGVKPLYDSYCFSQIPQTVYHLLTGDGELGLPKTVLGDLGDRYDRVILLLVDGFGWRFFQQYVEGMPFLKRLAMEGVASKLTTQFPSTTSAHVTTLHSGLPVGESGIYEWFYYEPLLDEIIAPLLFSFAGDRGRETLKATGISPQRLFPTQTLYRRLKQQGVRSYCFQHQNYAFSPFSKVVCHGARLIPYKTVPEALVNLTEVAMAESEKAYFCLYFDSLDAIAHRYSPNSPQFEAEVSIFWHSVEQLLHRTLAGQLKNTLLLVTADHGQIEASPQNTVYLNQQCPEIEPLLQTNARGQKLVPAGSSRDLFLHLRDECLEEACQLLGDGLGDRAMVCRTSTLVEEGYFGSVSSALMSRLGNAVILPHKHETVWWYEAKRFEQKNLGHHGGLSSEEMETILLAIAYG